MCSSSKVAPALVFCRRSPRESIAVHPKWRSVRGKGATNVLRCALKAANSATFHRAVEQKAMQPSDRLSSQPSDDPRGRATIVCRTLREGEANVRGGGRELVVITLAQGRNFCSGLPRHGSGMRKVEGLAFHNKGAPKRPFFTSHTIRSSTAEARSDSRSWSPNRGRAPNPGRAAVHFRTDRG